jgi:hypothetical protein
MSSAINWEVARGRAEQLREAGFRPGPRRRERALRFREHVLWPLQRRPRGS